MRDHIRIGTRKSALALWQAEHISAELQRLYPNITVELVHLIQKGTVSWKNHWLKLVVKVCLQLN